MVKDWKKSQDILEKATVSSEKCSKEIHELMKQELTEDNYKKIRKLLKKDSSIRNKALEKAQNLCQKEIKKELEGKDCGK